MKYKRTKPNQCYWKTKQPPKVIADKVDDPIDLAIERIHATLAPVVAQLKEITRSLDEQCVIDGHTLTDRIYPDQVVCSRCGRTPAEISSRHSALRS